MEVKGRVEQAINRVIDPSKTSAGPINVSGSTGKFCGQTSASTEGSKIVIRDLALSEHVGTRMKGVVLSRLHL
jgi:hypothetical protein